MTTTASAAADALVTMLSAASVFGPTAVSKSNTNVLEGTAGSCAALVSFGGLTSKTGTFGGDKDRTWTVGVNLFVKDEGDPDLTNNRVYGVTMAALDCIESDDTLLGTVENVTQVRGEHNPRDILDIGGQYWLLVELKVDCLELV